MYINGRDLRVLLLQAVRYHTNVFVASGVGSVIHNMKNMFGLFKRTFQG